MIIKKERFGDVMDVALEGRLDTQSSQLLEHELEQSYHELRELIINLTGLEYISSAGLSVLLTAQRKMNRQGRMRLTGVRRQVMDVFDVTGFSKFMMICS